MSDSNLSPSFDETAGTTADIDELALRRAAPQGDDVEVDDDELGFGDDETDQVSPYDDYGDAVTVGDPDVEPAFVSGAGRDAGDDDLDILDDPDDFDDEKV